MHKHVQKRFFELITSQTPLFMSEGNPINTYKELIHYRFKEVILSAFPRFCDYLTPEEINTLVEAFIRSEPKTPLIWQMPNEFRTFMAEQAAYSERFPFMHDLLWFEWIEIAIFMRPFTPHESCTFSWETPIQLSDSALLQTLHYPVFDDAQIATPRETPLLMYYNFETHEVHYQELTPFLYSFFSQLKSSTPHKLVTQMSEAIEADAEEVKSLLEPTLEQFCALKVLRTRD